MADQPERMPQLLIINSMGEQSLAALSKKTNSKPELVKVQEPPPVVQTVNQSELQQQKKDRLQREKQFLNGFKSKYLIQAKVEPKDKVSVELKKMQTIKQNQMSKTLIRELQHKINSSVATEFVYPVSNETVQDLISMISREIEDLKIDQKKKISLLQINKSNQSIKRQLQMIRMSISRCTTIKQLYIDKITLRNRISMLEHANFSLKDENYHLKAKIQKGIQDIQNHMHNLPCEEEKKFKEQLNKLRDNYNIEKQMRFQLEEKVKRMVFNFKKLYEEADTARKLIIHQLKDTQIKEKQNLTNLEKKSEKIGTSSKKISNFIDSEKNEREDVVQPNISQFSPFASPYSKKSNQALNLSSQSNKMNDFKIKTDKKEEKYHNYQNTHLKKQLTPQRKLPFSLEEQIQRMRSNLKTCKNIGSIHSKR